MNLGGAGMLVPLLGRFGWKGILLLVVIFFIASRFMGGTSETARDGAPKGQTDELAAFSGFVLDDAQETWQKKFAAIGRKYQPAKLVLYNGRTQTSCGYGTASVGPFYCPKDTNVYIDLTFYRQLKDRFGAPGDFAQAYVIAHEIGHHIQHQMGLLDRVHGAPHEQRQGANGLQVKLELQADCFAGIWASSTNERKLLETGDLDEALTAAAAIGDDTLQRKGQGEVQPETWTHGSAAQRAKWFRKGYDSGQLNACDTFAAGAL